jgi:adenylate kinase
LGARIVILLGAPGAGKGTQAKRLSQEMSLPHVSTGDLFRENVGQGTELGKRAKTFMDEGNLVPDELVIDMLFDRVARPDCSEGYLLDGFPRTVDQANALEQRLDGESRLSVIDIEVPDQDIIDRLAGRQVCKACGHTHHAQFSPPAKAGLCDVCGGVLERRKDDSPEVVEKRLAVYRQQTAPLIEFYKTRSNLCRVDGRPTPDQVFDAVTRCAAEGV